MSRLILVILIIMALALTGCSRNAVTLDGVSIPTSDISRIVAAQEQLMGVSSKTQEATIRANVTQNLVDQQLLLQEAHKEGITVTDQEVEQKYTEIHSAWNTSSVTQKSLEAQGYTSDNIKEQVRNQLIIDKLSQSLGKDQKQQIARTQELLNKLRTQTSISVQQKE